MPHRVHRTVRFMAVERPISRAVHIEFNCVHLNRVWKIERVIKGHLKQKNIAAGGNEILLMALQQRSGVCY